MAAKLLPFLVLSVITMGRSETVINAETPVPEVTHNEIRQGTTLESLVKNGITNFTLQFQNILYHLSSSDGNVLFAPISLVEVLATLLLGADGETKIEIQKSLGLIPEKNSKNKEREISSVLGKILNELKCTYENNSKIEILLANAIFIQEDIKVQEKFQTLAEEIFGNEIITTDFTASDNQAVRLINGWAANKTKGKINEIIQPPIIPSTKLIIGSTLFFNGEWEQPFFVNSTWEQFYTDDGIILAKMMINRGSFDIYESEAFHAISLPYSNGNTFAMYIIQPQKDHHLKHIIANLTTENIREIVAKAKSHDETTILLPYLNLTESVNIVSALKQAGVDSAFNPALANLSKIAENLYISDAIHKVNLEVTEAGSTGSAATALSIETRFPDKVTYTFNKPFAFFIYHKKTELILFWGTINIPVPHHKLR